MNYLTISQGDSIQAAIDYLDNSHGAVLRLLPGIYKENLILPPNLVIEGTGVADFDFTVIEGTHILPKHGKVAFNHVKFISNKNIFNEVPDSTTNFLFRSCVLQVDKGYPLNIPTMKGLGIFFDCWINGNENGFINNSNGKIHIKFFNLTSESKDPNTELILNESSLFFNARINHRVCLSGENAKYDIQGGSWFEQGYDAEENVTVNIGASNVENYKG